ncbi:transposase [Bradyrhizobium symbiodeficiens]|uniref:transposase n=1 Tax=Bradyrhizobium symbiodeficiens TaxID=1404367 RepID=UPI00140F7EAD|nr:transposase [Bradyrhizobium symbiodeficiens]QIP03048.1 transposase [Bradyrhizobium symbiodeficiens]
MRRSRFTENEIIHLLAEASSGVSIAEICKAAGITERTFYRWRRSFGSLDVRAVQQMNELKSENVRLRGLVSNLFEQLRNAETEKKDGTTTAAPQQGTRASRIAAEKCGGALTGRFSSVRVNP